MPGPMQKASNFCVGIMKWIFHGVFASSAYLNCNHDGKCHVEAKPGQDLNQKPFDFLNQKAEEPLFIETELCFKSYSFFQQPVL